MGPFSGDSSEVTQGAGGAGGKGRPASGPGIAPPWSLKGGVSPAWHRGRGPDARRDAPASAGGAFFPEKPDPTFVFPEKRNSTLFVLCPADASAGETTGISSEEESGPGSPQPISWWGGGCQDCRRSHRPSKPQTTGTRGSPGDSGRVPGQGVSPLGLCLVGEEVCCWATRALDSEPPGLRVTLGTATRAWERGGHRCGQPHSPTLPSARPRRGAGLPRRGATSRGGERG